MLKVAGVVAESEPVSVASIIILALSMSVLPSLASWIRMVALVGAVMTSA